MDPYHLGGSGSVSDDTDPDPGIAPKTNQNHVIKNQNCPQIHDEKITFFQYFQFFVKSLHFLLHFGIYSKYK